MTTERADEPTRRDFIKTAAASAVAASQAASQTGAANENETENEPPDLPNIVIIFTDDQGYQDLGCFGSPNIKTPRIDQMAKEGMRLTDFYVAASICSPSRAALLTGCYPPRVGITSVLFPRNTIGLDSSETTIASLLKKKGYATACVGKWHLGHLPQFLPTAHGFDSYYGIPYSNDMDAVQTENGRIFNVPIMRNEEIIERPAVQETLTQRYTEEALRFIRGSHDSPFFLYLAHTMPHVPLYASEGFVGTSERGLYGDTIEEIDWSTGRILETLRDLGIDEKTLVVFTSDNGPWLQKKEDGGCALPLRGGKFSVYEGGFRVPCVMRWPGTIPAGTVSSEIVSSIDLLPTIAGLVGSDLPERAIDGEDVGAALRDPEASAPDRHFYFYRGTNLRAVRRGNWKLHLAGGNDEKNPAQLYQLDADIAESENTAEANEAVVERLTAAARRFDAQLKDQARGPGRAEEE